MKSAIFVLDSLEKVVDPEQYVVRFRNSEMEVHFRKNLDNLGHVPSGALLLVEGRFFPDALSAILEVGRKDLSIVGLAPVWKDEIRKLLSMVDFPVMLITSRSDLSPQGISTMKYHDRIAGSVVRYLKRGELEMRHPDRIARLLEEWLNDR